ncbi:hypothetical protein [Streptomyces axinellae]|uniref:Uncharacterized protein n=1 Tax=Streptomyces axinellae TaxID=552788 RepID=A0ABN3R091_9ACTN
MPHDSAALDPRRSNWCGQCPVCKKPLTVIKVIEKPRGTAPVTIVRCRCGCTTREDNHP